MYKSIMMIATLAISVMGTAAWGFNWAPILKGTPAELFDEQDLTLFQETVYRALNEQEDGAAVEWHNEETGHGGVLTPLKTGRRESNICRVLQIENYAGSRRSKTVFTFCKQADGNWAIGP